MILLTAATDEYGQLADLGEPDKLAWCERWGVDYWRVRYPACPSCWSRPRLWLDVLQQTDWLFWQGADTLITNVNVNPYWFTSGDQHFVFACDGNGLQSDVFFIRNCPQVVDFLNWVMLRPLGCDNEQEAMSVYLSQRRDYADFTGRAPPLQVGGLPAPWRLARYLDIVLAYSPVRIFQVTQTELNAYPQEQYGRSPADAYGWHPGDFVLHMPGKSVAERLAVWPKYIAQTVR
jgi:hypothetical protein